MRLAIMLAASEDSSHSRHVLKKTGQKQVLRSMVVSLAFVGRHCSAGTGRWVELLAGIDAVDEADRRVTAIRPDQVLWQGGIHMPEDLLQIHSDETHHHKLPGLSRCHYVLHRQLLASIQPVVAHS